MDDNVEYIGKLSPMQAGMLFHHLLEPDSNSYYNQVYFDVEGELDVEIMQKSFQKLCDIHQVFRTTFKYEDVEEPQQIILKKKIFNVGYTDLTSYPKAEREEKVKKFIFDDRLEGADFKNGILMKVHIFKVDRNTFRFVWGCHHILLDGWCMALIVKELFEIYESYETGNENWPEEVPYSNYLKWLENDEHEEKCYEYWNKYLEEAPQTFEFPEKKDVVKGYAPAAYTFQITEDKFCNLKAAASNAHVTVNAVIQSLWGILLCKYSNSNEAVWGSVTSGRSLNVRDVQKIIGLFINTMPMRISYQNEDSIKDILRKINKDVFMAEQFSHIQIAKLKENNGNNANYFNHILAFENLAITDMLDGISFAGFKLNNVDFFDQTNYDLAVKMDPGKALNIHFDYNSNKYDKALMMQIGKHFSRIVDLFLVNPDMKICDIQLLDEEEKEKQFKLVNGNYKYVEVKETIQERFCRIANIYSEKEALSYRGKSMTYRSFYEKACSYAEKLIKCGVKKQDIVAISAENTPETIISIWGILLCGAVYLPIDESQPLDRTDYCINECRVQYVITNNGSMYKKNEKIKIIDKSIQETFSDFKLQEYSKSDNCYVIYTSGSTGKPKGVVVKNDVLWRFVNEESTIHINDKDRVSQIANISFDASIWEIFASTLNGACLVIADKDRKADTKELVDYYSKEKITAAFFTTQLFNNIVEFDVSALKNFRLAATGGEAASVKHFLKASEELNNTVVSDSYGPTEAVVISSSYVLDNKKMIEKIYSIPIGKPSSGRRYYILDKDRHLLPTGMKGELYIGGDILAAGYIADEEKTKARFISNPYNKEEIIYKTGDECCILPDGNVCYTGRIDQQVKIRGFRVEKGEIVYNLLSYKDVKEAEVVIEKNENGSCSIIAYVVGNGSLDNDKLKDYLSQKLPRFMMPSHIIKLESMPMTKNGKFDRNSVPKPNLNSEEEEVLLQPENEVQEKMLSIWEKILGKKVVGINQNFFELGGDSIKAMQISAYLKRYGMKVEINKLFQYPTIKELSNYVKVEDIVFVENVTGDTALTPIQKWFFEEQFEEPSHFNQSVLLKAKVRIDKNKLDKTVRLLVQQHDAMRIKYEINDEKVKQIIEEQNYNCFDIFEKEVSFKQDIEEFILAETENLQKDISINNGKLIKIGLFRTEESDFLFIAVHHLIIDGVSWRILLSDMYDIYSRLLDGEEDILIPKSASFMDYSRELYKIAEKLQPLDTIWSEIEDKEIDTIGEEKADFRYESRDSSEREIILSSQLTKNLLDIRKDSCSPDMGDILAGVLSLVLNKQNDMKHFLINMEYHGRKCKSLTNDYSNTIGWFTTIYPLVVDVSDVENIEDFINDLAVENHNYRDYAVEYGILKYIKHQEDSIFNVKSEICINYLGEFDNVVKNELFTYSNIKTFDNFSDKQHKCYTLEINSAIVDHKLHIIITYNNKAITTDNAEQIIGMFKDYLSKYSEILGDADYKEKKRYEPFPLSSVQMAYFLGKQNFYELGGFTTHNYIEIETKNDIFKLNVALNKIIKNQDMLRAVFLPDGTQKVLKDVPEYKIEIKDLRNLTEKEQQDVIEKERQKYSHKYFDISKYPLFSIKGFQLNETDKYLFISYDLMILDSASANIFINTLVWLYEHEEEDLPAISYNYRDFILDVKKLNKSNIYKESKRYWKNKLEDFPQAPELPMKIDPMIIKKSTFNRLYEYFSKEDYIKMKGYASQNGVTVSALLLEAYGQTLRFYSGRDKFAVNLTVFNRYPFHEDVKKLLGDFTSTLLLDFDYVSNEKFMDNCIDIQEKLVNALEYRYYDGVEFTRDVSRKYAYKNGKAVMPIVFTSLLFEEDVQKSVDKLGDVRWSIGQTPQVYIDFQVLIEDGRLKIQIDWVNELFDEKMIQKFFKNYLEILQQIVKEEEPLKLQIDKESRQQRLSYNNTERKVPKDTLTNLVMAKLAENSQKIVVYSRKENLTAYELDEKSNQIARYLIEQGVEKNHAVGVITERRAMVIANIIGILKAGAAYVPISPEYPEERVKYMAGNSSIKEILYPEDYEAKKIYEYSKEKIAVNNDWNDTAYIIYTSGSTGKPKGVEISHQAAVNTILDINDRFSITEKDKIIGISSMCFDLSVYDIFGSLLSGSSLHMVSDIHDICEIAEIVAKEKITVWNSVPAIMQMYMNELELNNQTGEDVKSSLRKIMLSGDWIPLSLAEQIKNRIHEADLYSLGGATEASIWSIYYPVKEIKENWNSVPYGVPLGNQQIYILNSSGSECPENVVGEICIGGLGVAKGYAGNKKLTEKAFVNHPQFGRIYRTGDYGIYRKEGYVEFLGRMDDQVKISGFRIELGEIQNVMNQYKGIKDSTAIVYSFENGSKKILAYYVSDKEIDKEDLLEFLKENLTEYMIPYKIIKLTKIPLTSNDKVDKKKLPVDMAVMPEKESSLPETELEEKLLKVLKKVLKVSKAGIDDNFFDLGGDSLSAMKFISAIRNEEDISGIQLTDILRYPNIRELAENVNLNSESNLRLLQTGSDESKKLFFIHGGNASADVYQELIGDLGKVYTYYGIDYPDLITLEPREVSYYKLAESYTEEIIRSSGVEEEYNLLGWCIGGVIAFEVALQLENKYGKKVNVIMLDSQEPGNGQKNNFTPEMEEKYLKNSWSVEVHDDEVKDSREFWKAVIQKADNKEAVKSRIQEYLKNSSVDEIVDVSSMDLEELIMLNNLFRSFSYATGNYVPSGILEKGKVTYIEAGEGSAALNPQNWEKWCAGKIEYHQINSNHFEILNKEPAKICSEIIKSFVDK